MVLRVLTLYLYSWKFKFNCTVSPHCIGDSTYVDSTNLQWYSITLVFHEKKKKSTYKWTVLFKLMLFKGSNILDLQLESLTMPRAAKYVEWWEPIYILLVEVKIGKTYSILFVCFSHTFSMWKFLHRPGIKDLTCTTAVTQVAAVTALDP